MKYTHDEHRAVVLLSGGLDSTSTLQRAIHDGVGRRTEILAVTLKYGSTHQDREVRASVEVVEHYREVFEQDPYFYLRHRIQELPYIFKGGESALMGDVVMPMEEYRNYEGGEGPSPTVVPFRNANLISAATTLAVVNGFNWVYAGMHATDHGTWAYPDCSPEFLGAMANAIYVGTLGEVRLKFPFIWSTKASIAEYAQIQGVPIGVTYSCYVGGELHCGECPTCLERIKALKEALVTDPTTYLRMPA